MVANTSGSIATIQNLEANTTYHFAIYELNGFNQPLYLAPAATTSAATSGTLPVILVNWEAIPANGKVKLLWKTGHENGSSHFIVERSSDGAGFSAVAMVSANSNSHTEKNYNTQDDQPLQGKSYYR